MARDSQSLHEPVVAWLRSLGDPLRNTKAAAQWIAALPTTDAMAIQKEALELVSGFPGSRRVAGPAQAEALLRIDARLEPVLSQLAFPNLEFMMPLRPFAMKLPFNQRLEFELIGRVVADADDGSSSDDD